MFGTVYLIEVLQGIESNRIKNFRHDKTSVFGIGNEYSKQEWQSIFRQLVSRNLLMVDMVGHGAIKITEKGMEFLRKKENLELRKYTKISKKRLKAKQEVKVNKFDIMEKKEKELLKLLKAKRLEIAKAEKVPPYMIFHDKTLIEMIKKRPKKSEEMLDIAGVGVAKILHYGDEFLKVLLNEV